MSNFDFLKSDTRFEAFAETAISAERTYHIDPAVCALACRSAMEFAVKWMYSVDESLVKPYESKLLSLLTTDEFRDLTGKDLFQRLDYIRKIGNNAGHNPKSVSGDQALLALKNLHVFMDFIAYCYGTNYVKTEFFEPETELLKQQAPPVQILSPEIDIDALIFENQALKEELTKRREIREESYAGDPLNFTEEKTRKAYIDVMLTDAGWVREKGGWTSTTSVRCRTSLVMALPTMFFSEMMEGLWQLLKLKRQVSINPREDNRQNFTQIFLKRNLEGAR